MKDYKFVDGEFQSEIEIKRSKFITTLIGEVDEDEAIAFVKKIKAKYPDANHNCYCYIADINANIVRYSDDGEPSGTAGQPMLEVLKRQNLVKTAVVCTRYFGGIKLGTGGLCSAYTDSVVNAIQKAKISTKQECKKLCIECDYAKFNLIENWLKKTCIIENIEYNDQIKIELYCKLDEVNDIIEKIKSKSNGLIEIEILENRYLSL